VLREAIYQREGPGAEPAPLELRPVTVAPDFEGQLVRLEGRLLEVAHHTGNIHLTVRSGEISFDALMEADLAPEVLQDWQPGSRIALTGVYEIRQDEHLQPQGISLLLRNPRDVEVLARPSWWTAGRAWSVAGALGLAGVAGFTWIVALRRQVRRQTDAIRDQAEKSSQLERELMRASRLESLGVLAGGIAHDFNNLLTVIVGNAEHLSEQLAPRADLKRLADDICSAGERGAELTQRLLSFSRKQTLRPVATECNMLLDSMHKLLRRTLREDIEIKTDFDSELRPAFADPAQLESAVLNLALNAQDAMSSGGRLSISTANASLDILDHNVHPEVRVGEYVVIAITDNGEGMPKSVLDRVFEPFFTTKDVGKGSGLGLSMVYGFAKQSNGHVSIYSEPGLGTTVRLYLPAVTEKAKTVSSLPLPVRHEVTQRGVETVFIVEDDPFVRSYAVMSLQSLGYRVTSAVDGNDALQKLGTDLQVDLLFTDIVMPGGINGWELAELARRARPDLRVLLTSGYALETLSAQGHLRDGAFILTKPYRKAELARRLREALAAPLRH
jgi:signal transduction histidine kinase